MSTSSSGAPGDRLEAHDRLEASAVPPPTLARFLVGAEVVCSNDGERGRLVQLLVDPVGRTVTHLVVEPLSRDGVSRLVPVDLALGSPDGEAGLLSDGRGDHGGAPAADAAPGEEGVPGADSAGGARAEGAGSATAIWLQCSGQEFLALRPAEPERPPTADEPMPAGEVEIGEGAHLEATDGRIGQVEGLVVDPADHRVTHVLLREGHLWGQRQVAVPIASVADLGAEAIQLLVAKDEVRSLPGVETGGD
ncbi:MAG TPA: PRC-barrel domain-containing protein [Acidimicrobiales bacterium]|nr:PRC-barrel domain-containing protein [Acidimicrobiales bacterium]